MKILYFFLFLWVIFSLLDPDLDPATQINADPSGSGSRTLIKSMWILVQLAATRVQFACDWQPLGYNLYATGSHPDTICLRLATRRTLFFHFYPYDSAPATYPPLWFSPSDFVFSVLVMTESLYVCRSEWGKILIKNKLGRKFFFGKMPLQCCLSQTRKLKVINLIVVLYIWVNYSFSAKNYFRDSVLRRLVNLWLFRAVKPPYSGNIFTSTLFNRANKCQTY